MGKAITITRVDLTVAELRAAAAQAKDASAMTYRFFRTIR
jgi:hypothetical protein